ncbi:MAG TPA: secretin and TonB N-terminal domain-containing protein [Thermodesulfobacteriota bacterium]|nr:secretin and TonB N-terminal domain-containing protein [Thermodesulfobacteriota bacterium]
MKTKTLFILYLVPLLVLGCANLPNKERAKLPSQKAEAVRPQPPPEEKLKELMIPQMEEAKKVPEKLFSIYARDSSIQDVLLAFSKESDLNIVLDPQLSGKVTVDLKRVTLKEALDTVLSPLGWTYRTDGKFIKVLRPQVETRFFTLNYMATKRSGKREVYATTSTTQGQQTSTSTTISGISGISGIPDQQTTYNPVAGARTGYTGVVSVDDVDLWKEIQKGLEALIFGSVEQKGKEEASSEKEKVTWTRVDEKGRRLVINKSTGVIMVADYPVNLNKVASYLEAVEGSSQRQVSIQAKIMEVTLSDSHQEGINWQVLQGLPNSTNLAWGLSDKTKTQGFPGSTTGYASGTSSTTGGTSASSISIPGTLRIAPYGGVFALGAAGSSIALSDFMQAIAQQGDVKVLSSPTISTLNNQKAIIRVGNQSVFFITGAVATQTTVTQFIQPMTIDIGIILDVTPQISEDGTIIMNIHPSITAQTGSVTAPDGKSTFPLLSVRETDTTVRVRDGETIIIGGLMQDQTQENYTGFPGLQSIPLLGGLFRYKTDTKTKSELVIMITPTLQVGKKVEDFAKQ